MSKVFAAPPTKTCCLTTETFGDPTAFLRCKEHDNFVLNFRAQIFGNTVKLFFVASLPTEIFDVLCLIA